MSTRTTIEDDVDSKGLVLSMRAKMCLGGLCFFLLLGSIMFWSVPNAVEALHGLAQGEPLGEPPAENDTQPLDKVTPLGQVSESEQEGIGENVSVETIFLDDFEDPEVYNLWKDSGMGTGNVIFRDGYAFLNLNKTTADQVSRVVLYQGGHMPYKYTGGEVRLKCSDDNKLESDKGGGLRVWGFWDWTAPHCLRFISACPESGSYSGFRVESTIGGNTKMLEPITGIDIREWHTYTILWEPGYGTFMVDGEVVATIEKVPSQPMDFFIANYNLAAPEGSLQDFNDYRSYIDIEIPFDESIQVDYIHVFGIPETAILAIIGLFLLPVLSWNISRNVI